MANNEDFYIDAHLDNTRQRIYSTRRTPGNTFADIMITKCSSSDWWYKNHVGTECFVSLHFTRYAGGSWLSDINVVNLTSTKILVGRSIDPNDIMIL